MKKYILIAGANGTGKSTLYRSMDCLKGMPRVNTDEIVRQIGTWENANDLLQAGKIAIRMIKSYFEEGISFNQETTLCGQSIMNNIEKAKKLGYYIELHYIGVDSVQIVKDRIAYRVSHGGHGIPERDIERRYQDSLIRLKQMIPLCDCAILYDNTQIFNRFAVYEKGKLISLSEENPQWYKKMQ